MKCEGWYLETCGGKLENAIYNTEKPVDMTVGVGESIHEDTATLLIGDADGLSTQIFTDLPMLRRIIGRKLVIDADEPPIIPLADNECAGNCYKPCGNILNPEKIEEKETFIVIRYFFLDLSKLWLDIGVIKRFPKKVKVYAQTVLINEDITFNFSLMIRTRQLIIDRSKTKSIKVKLNDFVGSNRNFEKLSWNDEDDNVVGLPVDNFFLKQSYICARILLDVKNQENTNTAWKIIDSILEDTRRAVDKEDIAFIESIRGFRAKMKGILRSDVHFVPFYTKDFMAEVLESYFKKISIYKQSKIDRLID